MSGDLRSDNIGVAVVNATVTLGVGVCRYGNNFSYIFCSSIQITFLVHHKILFLLYQYMPKLVKLF